MSVGSRLAQATAPSRVRELAHPLAVLLVLLFAGLYTANLDGWLMDDDEGTDFYEVWRLQLGERPGVDYAAEQQPLFLLAGSQIVGAFGRSPAHLRLLSVAQVVAGATLLAWTVARLYRPRTGLLTFALLLGNGLVFEQARLFRPDPNMFAWELVGLSTALWAWHSRRRIHWALAGGAYGVAVLWKPFGLFPVAGLVLLFAWWLWTARGHRRQIMLAGTSFAIAFLLMAGAGSWLLYERLGFYYAETFGYHAAMGADGRWWPNAVNVNLPLALLFFFWDGLFYAWAGPLWFLNRSQPDPARRFQPVLAAMLLVAVVVVFLPRPILLRYFLFLLPVLALLTAWQLDRALVHLGAGRPRLHTSAPWLMGGFALVALLLAPRSIVAQVRAVEDGSRTLAAFVAAHTGPSDVVVGDYAGINFLADRPSIYDASIIAQGQIRGGSVTGERLIGQMEAADAKMVFVHVAGGDPIPHHLVELRDYALFRDYLAGDFALFAVIDRSGQTIEVHRRREETP